MARGPAYPFVNLEEAVDFAKKMYGYARRSPADAKSVIEEAWGYSPASSSGKKILAALGYFGLIDSESTSGEGRKIRLSDRAYRILVDDHQSSERKQALKEAALSPKAYLMCWTRWGKEMPPSMRSNLIFGEGFVESTVDSFLIDYKKSIEFAGLLDEDATEATQAESSIAERPGSGDGPSITVAQSQPQANFDFKLHRASGEQRSDVFSLNEGIVQLSWPKSLSAESFQDFSDWLDLMKRKIQRSVSADS